MLCNALLLALATELQMIKRKNIVTIHALAGTSAFVMISAFPDVDLDLAELFERNYKILPGRKIGLIDLDDKETEDEVSNV